VRILKWLLAFIVFLAAVLVTVVQLRWKRTFTAPMPALHGSTDSAAIAQGRYLVYGPAGCAYCHLPSPVDPARCGGNAALSGITSFRSPSPKSARPT
jgi:hypothetical protein